MAAYTYRRVMFRPDFAEAIKARQTAPQQGGEA